MIIKVLLIAGALALGYLLLRQPGAGRTLALRRLLGLAVLAVGIAAVLFPLAVTEVANAVGVGRGTDLVLYILVMVFLFTTVSLYQRLHEMERALTTLARRLAMLDAPDAEAERRDAA